jgi:anti-anti-sigma regulatory factor
MSVELYSEDIIVVAVAERPSAYKIWLRREVPGDLTGDLQWLCEEYLDYHIVVDLAHVESLGSTSYPGLLDLRKLAEEYDYCVVLCGLSEHLKRQLKCVHLADEFVMFDTRQDAIAALSAQCEAPQS